MWIFIWVVLSLFILGVFVWSVVILREQKTAWAAFAKKNNLQYTRGRFMEAAIVRGTMKGLRISLFSDTQQTEDIRGERYVSVIEIELGPGMKTGAAIGTPEMKSFIDSLSFDKSYRPPHEKWKDGYIVKTRDLAVLQDYLTPARLDALTSLFGMNKVSALFFFDEQDCVLHMETIDPLRRADKLDRIMDRILNDARKLALTSQQQAQTAPPAEVPVPAAAVQPDGPQENP